MTVTEILTHEEDALKRLLEQFKDKENVRKILEIYLPQIQEIEEAIFDLLFALDIDAMEGAMLDLIGQIVILPRVAGTGDVRYRQLLKAKIGQNISEGDPERIIAIFQILTQSAYVHYQNLRGNVVITGTAGYVDQEEINALFVGMEKVLMAGIRLAYFVCADDDEAFAFEGDGPPALGFDDESGTVGGMFAVEYLKTLEFAFAGDDEDAAGFGAGAADPFVGGVFV